MGAQPSLHTAPFWELLKCWHLGPPPDSDVIGFGAVQVVKMSWWYQGVAQAKSLLLWLDYSSWGWLTSSVSVQSFSCVQVFVTLWIQYIRPPCPSPTPRVYSNSCPSSHWCHPTISSSVVPVSSCPQSLPASGSFPMSQFFASGGQSMGVSASASVLPMNI